MTQPKLSDDPKVRELQLRALANARMTPSEYREWMRNRPAIRLDDDLPPDTD